MKTKDRIYFFSFLLLVIDQFSKYLVVHSFSFNQPYPLIPSFFDIRYVQNEGGAWGIFANATWVITIVSFVFLLFLNQYLSRKETFSKLAPFSYALLMGGILGNFIDRVLYQYVIDFFSFHFFGYSFPVFNFADIFIVVGMFLLMIDLLKEEYDEYCRHKKRC